MSLPSGEAAIVGHTGYNPLASLPSASGDRRATCTFCHRTGHAAQRCYQNHSHLAPIASRRGTPSLGATYALASPDFAVLSTDDANDEDYICLLKDHAAYVGHVDRSAWVVDSGCTSHMTHARSSFNTYAVHSSVVNMGTSATAAVIGTGSSLLRITVRDRARTVKL